MADNVTAVVFVAPRDVARVVALAVATVRARPIWRTAPSPVRANEPPTAPRRRPAMSPASAPVNAYDAPSAVKMSGGIAVN